MVVRISARVRGRRRLYLAVVGMAVLLAMLSFNAVGLAADPPTVTSITPNRGQVDNTVSATIAGTNFATPATVWLGMAGQPDIPTTNVQVPSAQQLTCNFDLAGKATGFWNVNVQTAGGTGTLANGFEVASGPPPAPVLRTWYLAEGSTNWGFSCYISIENPNPDPLTVDVTYMLTTGGNLTEAIDLPKESQTTLTNDHLLTLMGGPADFSTKVECRTEASIAVDRTMSWTGPGASSPEGHSSVGVPEPATLWYLPEGSTNWGFECFLLIQNPNAVAASCNVTYMIEGEGPQIVNHVIPAASRQTYNVATDIGAKDASIQVESDQPVIPERAMYRNGRREGHESIGARFPTGFYMLAEGSTAWGFTTFVLIQNPNNAENTVTVTYMTPEGPRPQEPFVMQPNSRKTINVNSVLPNTDLSTAVNGSLPLIAERAMYWDNGTGEACHDSIGAEVPFAKFYLPDGETSNGRETFVLVQNPGGETPANVTITFLTPSGTGNVTITDVVSAGTRETYNMKGAIPDGRAAIYVDCNIPIIVERAMYWNSRGAGTDTIGAGQIPLM